MFSETTLAGISSGFVENRMGFEADGHTTVLDFLSESASSNLERHIGGIPEVRWNAAFFPDGANRAASMNSAPENEDSILMHTKMARQRMYEGGFSYHFYRTEELHGWCGCPECKFREWIVSEEAGTFFMSVVGRTFSSVHGLFMSRYDSGCFLAPHTDPSHGDIGFVYQLTRDWRPQWGGCLGFMSGPDGPVTSVCLPVFNSLTLFDISGGDGRWHYVSEVVAGLGRSRYAIAGWLR
jgi:hypothetical protein